MNPSCSFEYITSEMAKQWLDVNHRNRQLSEPQVRRLADAIRRGEWMPSATDAIGLDTNGGVINGQHRLSAIIHADTPITCLVVRNVDPDVIKVIDQGIGRSLAQLLAMDGKFQSPTSVAGAVTALYRILNNFEIRQPTDQKPTVPQLLDLLAAHPGIEHSVPWGTDAARNFAVPKPEVVAYHYLMASVDHEKANEFFRAIADGIELMDGDPVCALRERWLKEVGRAKDAQPKQIQLAWLVKAWEFSQTGDEVDARKLSWRGTGVRPQPYPKVTNVPFLFSAVVEDEDEAA